LTVRRDCKSLSACARCSGLRNLSERSALRPHSEGSVA
jgi:hypothetical protein